jgi:hypothetical protein
MIKQTQKHKACTCKKEKNKLQVVLHQDRRNTRRSQTKKKEIQEKTWTTQKKKKTQGLHLREKKHKRFIKEKKHKRPSPLNSSIAHNYNKISSQRKKG